MSDLDLLLEFELHRALDPFTAASVPPRRRAATGRAAGKLAGGAAAALGVKLLTGVAVVAAAATLAGAVAETGLFHGLNLGAWIHHANQQTVTPQTHHQAPAAKSLSGAAPVIKPAAPKTPAPGAHPGDGEGSNGQQGGPNRHGD